ncbi:non-canonical purine NTP pyrophosphatase [Candidatus Peregrinibacteria bacterium]|nr:non-canonical purine NTP pyrophosphatase [Candidatus Peregrinibacteria bacterium]
MRNKKILHQPQTLLIGTSNPGKFREITEILSGLALKFIMPRDLKIKDAPHESGSNYEENAKIKAKFFHKKTGLNVLAEDSGIEVDHFQGELSHQTRRWGKGASASDKKWLLHFLKQMEKVPMSKRTARFCCCAALIRNNRLHIFHGTCRGHIMHKPEAPILEGLPLSSCFKPIGCKKVYAALSTHEKNAISHRGKAISKVRKFLIDFLVSG